MTWLDSAAHRRWLEAETDRLLAFGRASRVPGGFGWLDDAGRVDASRPLQLWITCRMTHVYALGALLGRPGCAPLVDHGVAALSPGGAFHDAEHGGWFASVRPAEGAGTGGPAFVPDDAGKAAYPHSFVVLAAASAVAADRPGARTLLDAALEVQETRFWDEDAGMVVESWDRTFTELEDYRGVNANMHTVEAYLTAADHLGVPIHRCVAIEDSTIGAASALAAGAVVLGVPNGTPLPPRPGLQLATSLTKVDLAYLTALVDAGGTTP